MGLSLQVPWSNDEQIAAVLQEKSPRPNPFPRLRGLLAQLEPLVLKNLSDYRAFQLCVECLEEEFWRDFIVTEQAVTNPLRATSDLLIQTIADRDHSLAGKLSKDWDTGRPADSEAKAAPLYGLEPKDQLLFQWQQAANYSASLALHPERFFQLLGAVKRM